MTLRLLSDPVGPIGGDAAREAARQELNRPEYHRDDASALTRIFDWLGDRLNSITSGTPSGSATLLFIVLLVALIVFAIVRAGRPHRPRRAKTQSDPLQPDELVDHRRLAAEFESRGQYAQAMREWLRATVRTIEERSVLDPRPGRTGAALAREAGAALPSVAAQLTAAVDTFDEVWFGHRAATAHDAAAARQVSEAVRSARIETTVSPSGYAAPR